MLVLLGLLMIVGGVISMFLSASAFGDIGVAIFIGGLSMTLSGICALVANGKINKKLDKNQ